MPRGSKKKVIVITCPETGKIIKHKYYNNCKGGNAVEKAKAITNTFNKYTGKYHNASEFKVKDERHSS